MFPYKDFDESTQDYFHYNNLADVPSEIQKYYYQRLSIFSRYEEGVWMTKDAWFGVTPEPVAHMIAKDVAENCPGDKEFLVDCFAGVGGNTIAFAQSGRWKKVYGIEKDSKALACAKHNARIYGVDERITWLLGDCFSLLEDELVDIGKYSVIFASPPWGGPAYTSNKIFDLSTMQPYGLQDILTLMQRFTQDIALYLPRNADMRQLADQTSEKAKMTVIHYCMKGASKAICAYFGDFSFLL